MASLPCPDPPSRPAPGTCGNGATDAPFSGREVSENSARDRARSTVAMLETSEPWRGSLSTTKTKQKKKPKKKTRNKKKKRETKKSSPVTKEKNDYDEKREIPSSYQTLSIIATPSILARSRGACFSDTLRPEKCRPCPLPKGPWMLAARRIGASSPTSSLRDLPPGRGAGGAGRPRPATVSLPVAEDLPDPHRDPNREVAANYFNDLWTTLDSPDPHRPERRLDAGCHHPETAEGATRRRVGVSDRRVLSLPGLADAPMGSTRTRTRRWPDTVSYRRSLQAGRNLSESGVPD